MTRDELLALPLFYQDWPAQFFIPLNDQRTPEFAREHFLRVLGPLLSDQPAAPAAPVKAGDTRTYFDMVRSMTADPELLAAVDKAEADERRRGGLLSCRDCGWVGFADQLHRCEHRDQESETRL